MGPFIFKAGVLDYQTFAKNLQVLEGWITEAEEILKGQDPSHSSDLSEIQSRMEELKVTTKCRKCNLGVFLVAVFVVVVLVVAWLFVVQGMHRYHTCILYVLKDCHACRL